MAGLEAQLEQAVRREEQLRTSRAQCEYQLSQGGEEAQDLLKQVCTNCGVQCWQHRLPEC